MKIKSKIQLPFSADTLWALIADPAAMKAWNPRIKEVVPVTLGKPKANSRYRIRYRLGSMESNYFAEIMEFDEFSRFALHLEGGSLPRKGYIQEIFELIPDNKGVFISHQLLIERSGLGITARLMLRISNCVGQASGKKSLSRLMGLAESAIPQ